MYQLMGLPLMAMAFDGAKYGDPSSIMICVAVGIAVVGQARAEIQRLTRVMVRERVMG